MWWDIFYWSHHISAFSTYFTYNLLVCVRFQTLVLFLLYYSEYCEFQCLFYKNTFFLTFTIEISYFILLWSGLKPIKLKRYISFLITSNELAIKNNPLMHLRLIFHKKVNKNNWKSENFKAIHFIFNN